MIRFNDINKTVIDESKVIAYDRFIDNYYDSKTGISKNMETISLFAEGHYIKARYDSKEARDKDIELLDKLFDVKSIEYKAMSVAKPEYSHEGGINEEREPVKEESDKNKGEYLTWDDVEQSETRIKAKLPNGDIRLLEYNKNTREINIFEPNSCFYAACILGKDLFNALMLKKVE